MFSKLFKKSYSADEQCYPISTLLMDTELKSEGLSSDTPLKKYLDDKKLDYSIDSLIAIDAYLDKVRKNRKKLSEDEIQKIIIRCGAYAGEVIKRNSKYKFTWMFYQDLIKKDKRLEDFGFSILTHYILTWNNGTGKTFPMAKVEKYISFGKAESLHFYAQVAGTEFASKK